MFLEASLALVAAVILHHYVSRPRGMPPGPITLPVIGSGTIWELKQAKEYRKKYGDIFRCEIGSVKMVFICDFKLIKEAQSKMEFSDRPRFEAFHFLTNGKEAGVMMSNGLMWQNARRFLLRNLRDLGMGKSSLDDAIIHEAECLVKDIKKTVGKPAMLPESINIAVLNVLWQMVAGCRYDLHDRQITEYISIMKSIQEDSQMLFLFEFVPWLKKILPGFVINKLSNVDKFNRTVESAKKLFGDVVESRKAVFDPSQPEYVIDEYLVQLDQKTDLAHFFNEPDLIRVIFDLFSAGFDTTSNALRWMCLYAAKYPEVQQRIQKQIDSVLSRDSFPSFQHKAELPLVEAFIHEVLRFSVLNPFGLMHATSQDTHLANYFIPKGTIIFGVAGISHKDPKYWEDPLSFRLERFLDDEGRFIAHKEGFGPFGIGKRSCLGESLARMELSIFTAALLQNFTFSPLDGQELDLGSKSIPYINFPKDQEILINIRE